MKVDYFNIPEITVSYKDNVKTSERFTVKSSLDISKIFKEAHNDCMQHHEEVYVLFMNRANRVMGIMCVGKGGLNEVSVDIRLILQAALKVNSSVLCLAHNHPSGQTAPSIQDIQLTENLKAGCKAVGIRLVDHLIMTEETYTSFADEGLL
ncbi:MAG: JAB domain-containing protein [Tannerella sp.]|jgi:DNA repair protein RadC|nr:JAB domain-containing protein [Tannerella sp.]